MTEVIRRHLASYAPQVESLLAEGCDTRGRGSLASMGDFEWRDAFDDLLRLSGGGDCSYDRPTIGVQYALWYGMRRIEGAIRSLAPTLLAHPGDVSLVDLGCGVGAGAWAAALVEAARIEAGGGPRRLEIVAVDTSPFMLDEARFVWSSFDAWLQRSHPAVEVEVEWRMQSWTTLELPPAAHRIVLGSYLFDWSDDRRAGDLSVLATGLFDALSADQVVLSSAYAKRGILGTVTAGLEASSRWADRDPALRAWPSPVWSGASTVLGGARRTIAREHQLQELAARSPDRGERHSVFNVLTRVAPAASLPLTEVGGSTRLLFDQAQSDAATLDGRMTAVLGAAGSGKSRVLVERVARSVEEAAGRGRTLRVLITSFNKALVDQLAAWLDDRLAASGRRFTRTGSGGSQWILGEHGRLTVRLLNWDKVPTRLFGCATLERELEREDVEDWIRLDAPFADLARRRPEIATVDFLKDELQRVIYGMCAGELDTYLGINRTGRQTRLHSTDREAVFRMLMGEAPRTFTHVRMNAHRAAISDGDEPADGRYDLVVVDEYQDFTPADFDLVGALATDPKGIVVGGDPAQAIHLGKSAGLPPPMKGHRWSRHHLEGSYRLPVRVCEAVAPIARAIQATRAASGPGAVTGDVAPLLSASEVVLPHGVKNAVLGVRPVVVAGSHSEVRDQVREVLSRYGPLLDGSDGERIVTIAEGDEWIEHALRGGLDGGFALRRESMRAIKGLERPCVIWSTRAAIPDRESHDEWIYTILTRTTCLVVIAISEATPPAVAKVLGRLESDRLLFWREPARARFTSVATASLVREED